ncbi:uncharacterized protein F5891DRAFT_727713 [Suillus fuscotomentosus]|uniref:Uncharacterized protein n=1 Tax=Suillus fuscotomentosus TaxID=1912939 RepID=A0AAD4DUZ7_9AGAM|nr:uncharacterized protein F5891DRAFT_727713 [Suillus fuscotomentosus]KAG1894426.1 hypothetical protein F5891DRAFT_727713 [Suillus fuscotomentosus]
MPERRVSSIKPPSQSLSGDEGDMDLKDSQGTSDDHNEETFAVIAAEFKATWEKKLRGRDNKIIQTTQKELNLALQNKETEIANVINDMETLHQDFLKQYAILEDKKRKITAAIAEAQEELIPLAIKRHQAIISLGHEVENGQLEGMALIKGACQSTRDVAQELGTLHFDS